MKNINFGEAIRALKIGLCIKRAGWGPGDVFVYIVPPSPVISSDKVKNIFGEHAQTPTRAYFAIHNNDGHVDDWTPSASDILADDWVVT